MKIERLYLKAYGSFSEHGLDLAGPPDFHVIYGPNEAGKSTTLRAFTALLFGIEERTPDSFVHPGPRLRIGATLTTASGERLAVMRRKGRKQTLFALDETRNEERTDQPLAEDTLSRLLGGLDVTLYRTLFGLDLDGLVSGGETLLEGKGEIAQSLFAAAAGLADLRRLADALNKEAADLFKPRASSSKIHVDLKDLEEQRKRMREATVRSSVWEQAERTQRQATHRHATLYAELTGWREQQRRLSRIIAHLPLVAERAAKGQALAALVAVPLLPPEATQQRIEAEERQRAALEKQREAQAALEALRQQRAALQVRETLLPHASTIERLHHAANDYRGALERLPRIETELEAARHALTAQLAAIDPALAAEPVFAGRLEPIRARMPVPTLRARVQALMDEQRAWSAQDEQVQERERALTGTLQRLRDEWNAQPAPLPVAALEAACDHATAPGDLAAQMLHLGREIAGLETTLAREAAALWEGTLAELIELRPPLLTTVTEIGDRYRQWAEDERLLQDQDRILQRDLGERERELRALAAAGEIVTHDQVRQARLHRDDGWQRVCLGYVEKAADPERLAADYAPGQPLPVAFAAALREADRLADLLHADAKRATSVENLRQRLADMQQARAALAPRFAALATERAQLEARWADIACALRQPQISPGAAVEWLQKQALLVERSARLDTLRREQREMAALLATVRQTLDQALRNYGLPGLNEEETLAAALSRTRTAIDQARQTVAARAALSARIVEQETDLRAVVAKRAVLAERRADWQAQWNVAVAALRLSPEALPAEARVRLDQWDQLGRILDTLDALTREACREQATRSGFEQALAELARTVAEPLTGEAADRIAVTLYGALREARDADRRRQRLDADIEQEQRRLGQAQTAATIQRDELAERARRAGVESPEQLVALEARAADKRRLSERVAEIEEQLVRSAARPLAEVLAEVEGEELAAANARLDALEMTIRARETEVETAYAAVLEAQRAFDAIDGSDAAAQARQEVEAITARIAQRTQIYARTRLAAAIVARVMQTYREQHQGPVLGRAGELFARLTRGRFSSLAVDYQDDCQILLGQQPDGGRLGVSGLSQGTRHQLFLALRLAAIEEHLREREAVPIIIDDLLVQFDDARATATLEVLAELACQTQVLFFTHHRHLCELAAATLPPDAWRHHELGGS